MGCFDYECACGGKTCDHVGGQLDDANVVIEVPLSDGNVIFLEGHYEQYGYVTVEGVQFYLEQFRQFFEGWLEDEKNPDKIFLAKRVWTLSETVNEFSYDEHDEEQESVTFKRRKCFRRDVDVNLSEFDPKDLSKYIRADTGIDLAGNRRKRAENLRAQIKNLQKQLKELEDV